MYDKLRLFVKYRSGIEEFIPLFSSLYPLHAFSVHLLGHHFKAFLLSFGFSSGFDPIDPFLRLVNDYYCH
jgi:hypothetical protein